MKKHILILAAAVFSFSSCLKNNDLVNKEYVAEVLSFKVEGQESVAINSVAKTVTVNMPHKSDLTKLTVADIKLTEKTSCTPEIKVGTVLDLAKELKVTLHIYDDYIWTIKAVEGEAPFDPTPKTGPQLYNMNLDSWSQEEKVWQLYSADATEGQKATWGNSNSTLVKMGKDCSAMPEAKFVAAEGEGKNALMLKTYLLDFWILKKLAAGSVFTGKLGDINFTTLSANLEWGIPFTARPAALEGYACYKPATINQAEDPYKDKVGSSDSGHIFVLLTDWEKPFTVSAPKTLVDFDGDPAIIGYGKVVFDKEMQAYEKFTLKIDYRNERIPKYVVIVASSSALGDYFTGGDGSTLYLDELSFIYE